jgi:glycosyltransferase involved in cell wall biosynthesis
VIVPITKMSGKLEKLSSWVQDAQAIGMQVILVHDVADNETGTDLRNLLDSISSTNPQTRIQLIEGKYGNPGSARNAGLEIANGDWIVFWDCDDRPKLAEFLSVIKEANKGLSDIIISSFETCEDAVKEATKTFTVPDRENLLSYLVRNPGIWRFAFRKEVIKEIRFPASRMGEDQAFIASVGILERRIFLSSNITYRYYYGESTHLTNQGAAWEDLQISITEIQKIIKRQTGSNVQLSKYFLMKQIITCLKRCTAPTKIFALGVFLSQSLRDPRFIVQSGIIIRNRQAIS